MSHLTSHLGRSPMLIGLLAACLLLAPPASAQGTYQANTWEDMGPMDAGYSGEGDALMGPPPTVDAGAVQDFRPPVEPPADMLAKAAVQPRQAVFPQHAQPQSPSPLQTQVQPQARAQRAVQTQAQARVQTHAPAPARAPAQVATAAKADQPSDAVYVVQPGDNLPKIAFDVLGNAERWKDLAVWNSLKNPGQIIVGQRLRVVAPPENQAQTEAVATRQVVAPQRMAVGPTPHDTTAYEAVEPEFPMGVQTSVSADAAEADASYFGQTGGTYTIQRGDTLGKIAKNLLGSTKKWRELARANPGLNANKLVVGQTIQVPGSGSMPQFQQAMGSADSYGAGQTSFDSSGMVPSYQAPSLAPPPPPPAYAQPSGQSYGDPQGYGGAPNYSTMPSPPPYQANPMTPPGYPQYSAQAPLAPPPPPLAMPAPVAPAYGAPVGVVPAPVAVGTQELYREDRYRIPDELKPRDFTPYFPNLNGAHGLFETESALVPFLKTWYFGAGFRYDKYRYLNGTDHVIEGRQYSIPVNLMYAGRKLFAGLTVPFQAWAVSRSGGSDEVALSGLHDVELKLGYQIWKNYEGEHAVTLHIAGRFPSDNYHQPMWDMSGKSRVGVRIGPANATRGAWFQVGGAYTGKLSDRWTSHLNLALANDSEDSITKYHYRGGVDYRVNHNFSLVAELNGTTWEMDSGPDGPNIDLLLGFVLFNEHWQGTLGFPMSIQSKFGYGHDFGFCFGVNHRWD